MFLLPVVICSMVKILESEELPFIDVPRISTRVLSGGVNEAAKTTIWEQWIEPEGFIPLHYHDTEEVLVIIEGTVVLELADSKAVVSAPASILLAKEELHGLYPAGDSRVHLFGIFPTATPRIWDRQGNARPLPTDDLMTVDNPYPSES